MFRQRVRVRFGKEGPLRFISHHDLMRVLERALRRADLPLKLGEGFNPRPQLSFPVALAVGIESESEIFEVELTEWVSPSRVKAMLEREVPEGIGINSVESVGYGEKAVVSTTEFAIRMTEQPEDLAQKVAAFMSSEEAVVERKKKSGTKSVNVRKYVHYAVLEGDTLRIGLEVTPAGSVRPEEVLEAVTGTPHKALAPLHVTRTRLGLAPR